MSTACARRNLSYCSCRSLASLSADFGVFRGSLLQAQVADTAEEDDEESAANFVSNQGKGPARLVLRPSSISYRTTDTTLATSSMVYLGIFLYSSKQYISGNALSTLVER